MSYPVAQVQLIDAKNYKDLNACVFLSADQNLSASNVVNKVDFDGVHHDDLGMFDAVNHEFTITIPGVYRMRINARNGEPGGSVSRCKQFIYLNGSQIAEGSIFGLDASVAFNNGPTCEVTRKLQVSDVVDGRALSNYTSGGLISGDAQGTISTMEIELITPT